VRLCAGFTARNRPLLVLRGFTIAKSAPASLCDHSPPARSAGVLPKLEEGK